MCSNKGTFKYKSNMCKNKVMNMARIFSLDPEEFSSSARNHFDEKYQKSKKKNDFAVTLRSSKDPRKYKKVRVQLDTTGSGGVNL